VPWGARQARRSGPGKTGLYANAVRIGLREHLNLPVSDEIAQSLESPDCAIGPGETVGFGQPAKFKDFPHLAFKAAIRLLAEEILLILP